MPDRTEIQEQWLNCVHAVGRAQSRYLWITLVAAVFFFALRHSAIKGQKVSVPLIDLKLDAQVVLAAGPAVLSLLVVAALGSMRAWGDALERYAGKDWRAAADRVDLYPNVLDLALYTTRGGPPLLGKVKILFGYPGYISLVLAESVWLYCWLWSYRAPGRTVFIVVAATVMLGALILVARMLWQRFKQVRIKPDGHEDAGIGTQTR